MRKSNFNKDPVLNEYETYDKVPIQAEERAEVSFHHAMMFTGNGMKTYSQHFQGKENKASDVLS